MTDLNAIIQPSRLTVGSIVANLRSKAYFVDQSFQRRLVWSERQRVRLIETVLISYPMPEIYLWQQPSDADTGAHMHSVVDGQQRLTSLIQFASNEWPLKKSYLTNRDADFADLLWKDLPDATKQRVWDYVINARVIPSSVSLDEIRRIFVRLNETDKSLNPQELRHAEFTGKFLKTAEEVANLPQWRRWEVFTDNQIRRMQDIELASSLLIYLRAGVVSDTPTSINVMYDLYNDEYKERSKDLNSIKSFLWMCSRNYFKSEAVEALFTQPVHFYTLFAVDDILKQEKTNRSKLTSKLASFVKEYDRDSESPVIQRYREGASYRTRSKGSRQARIDALLRWLKGSS